MQYELVVHVTAVYGYVVEGFGSEGNPPGRYVEEREVHVPFG